RQQFGFLLLAQRDFTQAESQFAAILKDNPESKDALMGIVRVYNAQNQPEKAVQRLSRFPQLLAEFYISRKEYSQAEDPLRQFIANSPQQDAGIPAAKRQLANIYLTEGSLDRALQLADELIKK